MEPQPEQSASPVSLRSYGQLLRANPNFRRLWMAQIVSEIGDWFYTLSIYTLLLQLTGHASSVALALVLQVLPQTLVGPTAGVINDRLRRKQVMIAADLGRFVIVLAMLLVRSRSMVWLVYPLLVAETTMGAFFEPARSAVIPNIAARGEVLIANTLSSATWSVNLLIGASVAGLSPPSSAATLSSCSTLCHSSPRPCLSAECTSPSRTQKLRRRSGRAIWSISHRCSKASVTCVITARCCRLSSPKLES